MAEWTMPGKPALVLIHMQVGVISKQTFFPVDRRDASKTIRNSGIIAKIQELLAAFRAKKLPVVFVSTSPNAIGYLPAYGDVFRMHEAADINAQDPRVAEKVREGLQPLPELNRQPNEPVLVNWNLGSFTNSGLDDVLRINKVKTIVFAGYALSTAVWTSAMQAKDLWYNVIIPHDATTGTRKETYDIVINNFASGDIVATTSDIIAHIP